MDKSLSGLRWERAFTVIQAKTELDLAPVLIIRPHDASIEQTILKHLNSIHGCLYARLGPVLPWTSLDEAMLNHLGHKATSSKQFGNFKKIAAIIKQDEFCRPILFVIDNCHRLYFDNIFPFLGLMLELSGTVQFIFLLSDDYIEIFTKRAKSRKGQMFVDAMVHKYDIR